MTAIVGIETDEGFVLGADGLTVGLDNIKRCEHTQKIFFAYKPKEYSLAYGWAGATGLVLPDGRFDFMLTGQEVVKWLKDCKISPQNKAYFHAFSGEVFRRFAVRLKDLYLPPMYYPRKDKMIAAAFFVGYLFGKPTVRQIIFLHEKNYFQTPRIEDIDDKWERECPHVFSGPPTSRTLIRARASTLCAGGGLVLGALQDFEKKSPYSDGLSYGGRLHIALVSRESAVWADGYEPIGDR